ncbi:type II secretion system protein [Aurantimonas sp. NFXS3]|uniref:type II secretion system protein n=1 Tax=Aurantimonas sp. NFXS3 TaxID=2818434 RepID=UPI003B8AAFC9
MTTLFEMIVAVAILAGLVSLTPRAIVSSRAGIERVEDIVQAQIVAKAVLSASQQNTSFRAGVRSGMMHGIRWIAETRLYREGREPSGDDEVHEVQSLLAIRVSVEARPGHVIVLEALSIGALQ